MGATKERTAQRRAFAEKHRDEILRLSQGNTRPFSAGLNICQLKMVRCARRELGYSDKTVDLDIWIFLRNALK